MVQDIILKASWKAIWEAPDQPSPVQPLAEGSYCSLPSPLHIFWLLTSLRTLLSQSLSPPMTREGQRRK